MRRTALAAAFVLALGAATAVAWIQAERDREYRRLIGAGDASIAAGQLTQAIEAFSGALALKPDSMLAYLRRGETYRRTGDLKAACGMRPCLPGHSSQRLGARARTTSHTGIVGDRR